MTARDFEPELIEREPADYPDQPPGVDEDEVSSIPELAGAANRVLEFISEFGDGRVFTVGGAHLFARDLFVVARHAKEAKTSE